MDVYLLFEPLSDIGLERATCDYLVRSHRGRVWSFIEMCLPRMNGSLSFSTCESERNRCSTNETRSMLRSNAKTKRRRTASLSVFKVDLNLKLIYFAAVSTRCYFNRATIHFELASRRCVEVEVLRFRRLFAATWIGNYKTAEAPNESKGSRRGKRKC